jgi:hypothetical protein
MQARLAMLFIKSENSTVSRLTLRTLGKGFAFKRLIGIMEARSPGPTPEVRSLLKMALSVKQGIMTINNKKRYHILPPQQANLVAIRTYALVRTKMVPDTKKVSSS